MTHHNIEIYVQHESSDGGAKHINSHSDEVQFCSLYYYLDEVQLAATVVPFAIVALVGAV